MHRIEHSLPWSTPGTERRLTVFEFGQGPRKAYIQAALHADELPGMRVAAQLRWRLAELEEAGQLLGRVELVPVANPIGLAQVIQSTHQGRFDFASGRNFNRDFPDLAALVIPAVEPHLGDDAARNVQLLRDAMVHALAQLAPPASPLDGLQRLLLRHACTADLVLDLHCDFESVLLLYALPQVWPSLRGLAAHLGAQVALLAEDSGGFSFDEACAGPWPKLAAAFPGYPVPQACTAATLELGGMTETEPQRASHSAEAILAFLAQEGFICGQWPDTPAQDCPALPFAGAEYAYAPHTGVVSYLQPLGAQVAAGDPLFEVIDPLSGQHSVVRASIAGILYARERLRFAQPGLWLAKVAGAAPIRGGRLLSD